MIRKLRKKNVRTTDRRSDANLLRGLYRPLDKRKSRNVSVLPRIHDSERRSINGDEGKLKPAKSYQDASYDLRDLPCSDYQRMYET